MSTPLGKPSGTLMCMDSGVGGLAVLHQFATRLPESGYLFLGDTAWMPYGEKPLAVVRERVEAVHQWLQTTYPIAAFVLACNTATVAAYDALIAQDLPYLLLEPVKTTAEWVNAHVAKPQKIGILATPGTVSGERYLQFLDADWDVLQIPCKGLASVIESGVCSGPALDDILHPYLAPLQDWGADVVILGCTHYSFIQPAVQQVMGPQVKLVDSAGILAEVAIPVIQHLGMGPGTQQLLVTGDPHRFEEALLQLPLPAFHHKPVFKATLPAEVPLV